MADSEGSENREWDKRVSGGKGQGFAMSDNHAGPQVKDGGKIRTDVSKSKHQFSRDSIFKSEGKRHERARKARKGR